MDTVAVATSQDEASAIHSCRLSTSSIAIEQSTATMAVRQQQSRPRCRRYKCRTRIHFLLAIFLILSCTVWKAKGGNMDPFRVLGVSRTASPEEIKKRYRKLCLKYHPDKNVSKSEKERELCEKKFKQVQSAFDMIENKKYGPSFGGANFGGFNPRDTTYNRQQSKTFGRRGPGQPHVYTRFYSFDDEINQFAKDFFRYANFAQKTNSGDWADNPGYSSDEPFSFPKSIFVQKVTLSLEDLYKGMPSYRFIPKDSLLNRYRASIRGNRLYVSVLLSVVYTIFNTPVLRRRDDLSKYFHYFIGLYIIHSTTPTPHPDAVYKKPIQKGSKGKETTVKFSNFKDIEFIFKIEEGKHPIYRRKGNNLHANLVLTSKEAEKGCKKTLKALDPSEKPIEITIPPKVYDKFPDNNSITIDGRGWPIPRNKESKKENEADEYDYGDLIVHVRVQKPPYTFKKKKKNR